MAVVRLGYLAIESADLDGWRKLACDILGLGAVPEGEDRLLLRMDEESFRFDIQRGPRDGVRAIGWEVGGKKELDALYESLEGSGYSPNRGDASSAAERGVSELFRFEDPEGQSLECYYGREISPAPFSSPTGAQFVTGNLGMGHLFQAVSDPAPYEELYIDLLGFRVTDYIELQPGCIATFAHANARHHSFAWAPLAHAPKGIRHVMLEVDDLETVGRAWDRVEAGDAPIASTPGSHSNDRMFSFYVWTPSGFQIEYGFGGRVIETASWQPHRYSVASNWGHHRSPPPAEQSMEDGGH